VARYHYDNALRLTEVMNEDAARPFTGQLGVALARPAGIVPATAGAMISRHSYMLDNVGNRIQLDEAIPQLGAGRPDFPLVTTEYEYDRLYQLTGVTPPGTPTTYSYDPVGNRLSRVRGSSTSYSYDQADRIQSAGGMSYTLNANGNTTARGSDSFGYDQANRLVSATISGTTTAYSYDGKRASKTVALATTSFLYDVNRSLPVLLDDGSRKYVWGLGLAHAADGGGALSTYHSDGLGTMRVVSNALGNLIQSYETDEFGVPTAAQGSITQPFQYTGEQRDSESGLVYLRARMYEPETGRFLQRDPDRGNAIPPQTLNLYAYVQNNPISSPDPSGHGPARPGILLQAVRYGNDPTQWSRIPGLPTDAEVRQFLRGLIPNFPRPSPMPVLDTLPNEDRLVGRDSRGYTVLTSYGYYFTVYENYSSPIMD
jgi:RHS repeat-associated protein